MVSDEYEMDHKSEEEQTAECMNLIGFGSLNCLLAIGMFAAALTSRFFEVHETFSYSVTHAICAFCIGLMYYLSWVHSIGTKAKYKLWSLLCACVWFIGIFFDLFRILG